MSASNTDKFKKLTNNFSTTLSSAIVGASDTSMSLASTTNLAPDTGIVLVIDRVNSSGTATPSVREYVVGTVSGSNVTNLIRGVGNSTAQAHSTGAVVEQVVDQRTINDIIDGILQDHNQSGYHKQLTDTNGNVILSLSPAASAVNSIQIANAAAGGSPTQSATGSDANIDQVIQGKGTGSARWGGYHDGWVLANETPTYASATTVNVAAGSKYQVGDLFQFTQTTVKYFVVTKIASNVLTLAGLAGATVANAVISNFYYSRERAPMGIGLNGGAPFNPYKFSVYRNAAWTTSTSSTLVTFDTVTFDTGSNYSVATGKFTAPVAGFYFFAATVGVGNVASGHGCFIELFQNGAAVKEGWQGANGTIQNMRITVAGMLQLAAGDTVNVNVGGDGSAGNTGAANTFFDGYFVSAV